MKKSTLILLTVLLLAGIGACTKQSLKTIYDKQISYIESFIGTQMKSDTTATLVMNEGTYRLTLHDTLALKDSLLPGGKVALWYACFTLTSGSITRSNLVATNSKSIATQAGWTLSDTTRYKLDTLTLGDHLVKGLARGLQGVQAGDEAYILFTGENGFGNTERGMIPARSALVYAIWIENISNE